MYKCYCQRCTFCSKSGRKFNISKKIDEKREQVNFEERKCHIAHVGTVIAVTELNRNLYKLKNDNKVLVITKEHNKGSINGIED